MLGYADAFLSGFIHSRLKGKNLEDSLCYASASGLINVESLMKELSNVPAIEKNLSRIKIEEIR
jgi:sugar/nucleoside kinase (ribokinase family)